MIRLTTDSSQAMAFLVPGCSDVVTIPHREHLYLKIHLAWRVPSLIYSREGGPHW